ncbi:hypothetical protein K439DRAFT_252561 [Ramaria rubella]|nr:hypothetical protein K439DRAFT_336251 [Ramaria rubella]KAF8581105.1 hypothetical protein K439DRAFT_252561 [Ramaria rubella]
MYVSIGWTSLVCRRKIFFKHSSRSRYIRMVHIPGIRRAAPGGSYSLNLVSPSLVSHRTPSQATSQHPFRNVHRLRKVFSLAFLSYKMEGTTALN